MPPKGKFSGGVKRRAPGGKGGKPPVKKRTYGPKFDSARLAEIE